MSASKTASGSDFPRADAYRNGPEDYAEIPELTDEFFAKATINGGERFAAAPSSMMRKESEETVTIVLDRDVVERFRLAGPDWKARMSEALRKAAGL
ncbi:MAG TPA: BrnA antitoxin family protein [Lichenihabitans sp.]|jgi:uncharacterized protein (DUF4415 family)|nr:BrnA antitoxin family protein [Lichenihabitans sp.]